MKRLMVAACILVATAATACGANSVHDVEIAHGQGEGTTRIYSAPADRAYSAAFDVLHEKGVGPIEEHRDRLYMLGKKDLTLFVGSGVVGVWITPDGPDHCSVNVITMRGNRGDWAANITEGGVHTELAKKLAAPAPPAPAPVAQVTP